MAASVVPALLDAILATAAANLSGVMPIDGPGVTADPGNYLMVGCDHPDNPLESEAATVAQEQIGFGSSGPRRESGYIHMVARAIDGAGNQKSARDAAYAIQEALAGALRDPADLSVAGVHNLGNGSSLIYHQGQDSYGAIATLLYDIAFEAEI
jgi:hypothetical protein